jgi:hypothetical protein
MEIARRPARSSGETVNHSLRLAFALAAALSALPAAAAPRARSGGTGRGADMLSLWAVLDPGPIDGLGAGLRVMLPVVPEGLIRHPRIHDELTLELGADLVHYNDRVGLPGAYLDYSWNGMLAVVGGTWNFWLTPRFAVYPKLDLGWWFGWYRGWDGNAGYVRGDFDGLFLQGAVGIIYRFDALALRVEAGSGLLRIGAGFSF